MHRLALVQGHTRGPERIVGTRHQDFVARIEQGSQRKIDKFANSIADEHVLGSDAADAAELLLHHHGFPGRKDALLVAIALRAGKILDHGQAHRLRRAKAKAARIANIQGDDLVAAPLHVVGAIGEAAANLVANLAQGIAGLEGLVHGEFSGNRGSRGLVEAKPGRNEQRGDHETRHKHESVVIGAGTVADGADERRAQSATQAYQAP